MMNNRLQYIDTLRGIAILFIVFGHIPMYSYGVPDTTQFSSFRAFTSMVQLPLFFFISGFLFGPKAIFSEHRGGVKFQYILKKGKQLLLPAIVFGGLYLLVNGGSVQACLTDKFKSGYWFTWLLFEFLMMQATLEWIARKGALREDSAAYAAVCLTLALAAYAVSIPAIGRHLGDLQGFLGLPLFRYYLYLITGRLVRIHLPKLCAWRHRDAAVAGTLLLFVSLAVTVWGLGYECSGLWFHVRLMSFEGSALLLLFAMFYRHRIRFASADRVTRVLRFIGRRTLDIYLLHYFFLPQDLHAIGTHFVQHPAPVVEFAVSAVITIVIVAVCLFAGEFLRSSRLVAQWVLGGK